MIADKNRHAPDPWQVIPSRPGVIKSVGQARGLTFSAVKEGKWRKKVQDSDPGASPPLN
jgi:hypothetical protein